MLLGQHVPLVQRDEEAETRTGASRNTREQRRRCGQGEEASPPVPVPRALAGRLRAWS